MKNNQKGFGHTGVIVVLLVLGLVGLSGWFVWRSNHATDKLATDNISSTKSNGDYEKLQQTQSAAKTKTTWQTYRNDEGGLTFQYPDTWSNEYEVVYSPHPGQESVFWGIDGKITSPKGNVLEWHYWLVGGKGGDCEPDAEDVAYQLGNRCASKQILDVEQIPSVVATHDRAKSLFKGDLYITKTKYRPASIGDITYNICLDNYPGRAAPQKGAMPSMGLMFRCYYWDTGLNMTYSVKAETDLYSDDAKIVEQIMKSVKAL